MLCYVSRFLGLHWSAWLNFTKTFWFLCICFKATNSISNFYSRSKTNVFFFHWTIFFMKFPVVHTTWSKSTNNSSVKEQLLFQLARPWLTFRFLSGTGTWKCERLARSILHMDLWQMPSASGIFANQAISFWKPIPSLTFTYAQG